MKHLTVISALILVAVIASPAFASQVFKCTNHDGVVTFAFAPCAAPVEAAVSSESSGLSVAASIEATMDEISEIDGRIARLNREFRDLRLDHEASLRDESNFDRKTDLRQNYTEETDSLLQSLSSLKADRERLVSGSVARMSGS